MNTIRKLSSKNTVSKDCTSPTNLFPLIYLYHFPFSSVCIGIPTPASKHKGSDVDITSYIFSLFCMMYI